jgi:hypothetical protein
MDRDNRYNIILGVSLFVAVVLVIGFIWNAANFLDAARDIPATTEEREADHRFIATLRKAGEFGQAEKARAIASEYQS